MKNVAEFLAFLVGLLVKIAVQRLCAPRTVFTSLAVTSLALSATILSTPLWQQLIEAVVGQRLPEPPLSATVAGTLFLALTFVFAWLSHRCTRGVVPERIVEKKVISPPISVGGSQIYCFCGTVLTLSEAEVVVTSENTELSLGSLRGTSLSGRMRRAAATFRVDGTLESDPIFEHVAKWKTEQGSAGPYALGTCFSSPAFGASAQGVKAIVHAVALERFSDGTSRVDAAAIRTIVAFALKFCRENNIKSVFIPVFGIGSGRLDVHATAPHTIVPLVDQLQRSNYGLAVYLGTYRVSDAAIVGRQLLEEASSAVQ